ncbi:PucR family transcriptional regulator [Virgibacillus sediminis]|uniref:PucR family transcriptional regulator n=1 Tax=Virgibacillus sediminis TaxID=202260 RepID=A0ABV7A955_9BACI
MSLTIQNILDYEIMQNARTVAGKDFVNERTVQWISVMERPVENFVRRNEVVLTTAIGCNNDLQTFKAFVQDVINSEASALMIALGRYIFDIPNEIIELADKHQFVLIELPWEIRFSSITEKVMKELNDLQHKEREKSEKVQQKLLQLILKETDLHRISKFIQNQIDSPVIITDRSGNILDEVGYKDDFIMDWKNSVLQGILPTQEKDSPLTRDPMFQKFQVIEVEDQVMLQMPVLQVLGDPQGYIFVQMAPNTSIEKYLTQFRVNVLEHASTTIALWLSRKNAIEETKMRLRSDFVQELAKGEFASFDQANARAKLLGYDIRLPYVCIVGYPENLQVLFQKTNSVDYSFNHWVENMIRYIEEEVFYAAQSLTKEVLMTYHEEYLLIFLEHPSKTVVENNNNFLDLVERRLRNLLPEVVISWGIGDHRDELEGLSESYYHAKIALQIGRRKKGIGYRMLYDNTRVDRVLLNLSQNEDMKEVIISTIDPLVRYDKQRNMDLIGTFIAYNQNHGNVSKTARSLVLHRQSLLYRLRKIESLTGLSLIDPDDLFLLDLSIKIWKLM